MNMHNILPSDLTMTNLINIRYDEERGIVKTYCIRGKVVVTEYDKIVYVG